jgi:hypothetical protein
VTRWRARPSPAFRCSRRLPSAVPGAALTRVGRERSSKAERRHRPYNSPKPRTRLSLDTTPEFEQRQIERWRTMSPAEKAAIVTGLTQAAYAARARGRSPSLSICLAPRAVPQACPRSPWPGPRLPGISRGRRTARPFVNDPVDPIAVAIAVSQISDRQWRDALGIIRVQGVRLDRAYLGSAAQVLDVADLLDRALREGSG